MPDKENGTGLIQWKGTDVCIDLYCPCGLHSHHDSDFLYYVKCGNCGTLYAVDPNIKLIPTADDVSDDKYEIMQESNKLNPPRFREGDDGL